MEKVILGTFASREDAERLIQSLSVDMAVPQDHVSYIYRNAEGEIEKTVDDTSVSLEGTTTGAVVGGTAGAIAGIATIMGVLPVIGPIFAAGPIITALGIGAGAVGTTAAGALTGAMAGGIIGALVDLGVTETEATVYQDRIREGDVLVVVRSEADEAIHRAFSSHNASTISVHTLSAK